MQLQYIIIYVDDVVKAAEFYEKAFNLKIKFIHESKAYAEMVSGETTLAFATHEMLATNTGIPVQKNGGNCFEIAFTANDVEAAFEQAVTSGAKEICKPQEKPWGQVVAYVQDGFGTLVEICSPM